MARAGIGPMTDQLAVHLRPWGDDDLEILVRANSPDMTAHLGGPETDEAVRVRHQRYRVLEGETGQMFVIVAEPGVAVGSVGYWDREWQDGTVYETGWAVLPEHQGRGLAVAGVVRLIEILRAGHDHRWLYAYPKTEHAASNRGGPQMRLHPRRPVQVRVSARARD